MMNKNLFLILGLLCVGSWVHAKTITLGVKGGFDASLEYINQRPVEGINVQGSGITLGAAFVVFSDIFLSENFALSPEFSVHFMNGKRGASVITAMSLENGVTLLTKGVSWSSTEYNLGCLMKFYAGWFYAGVGLGASFTTAAKLKENDINPMTNIIVTELDRSSHDSSWGLNNTVELGIDIPLAFGRINLSSRTTANTLNMFRYLTSATNTSTQMRTGNLLRTGLYMGYSLNLI